MQARFSLSIDEIRPPDVMNRRSIAKLAAAAAAILVLGALTRSYLMPAAVPTSAPSSEATTLQQLAQEGQIRRTAGYFAQRIAAVAPQVEFLPATSSSAVRWGRGDTLVSSLPDQPVVAYALALADTVNPVISVLADSAIGESVVIVGRRPNRSVMSAIGRAGGRTRAHCDERDILHYNLGVALSAGFAGAGVFDLSGRLVGLVAHCGGSLLAVPSDEVSRLLTWHYSPSRVMWRDYGLVVAPLDDRAREFFGADSGLLVTRIRRESSGATALRAGDIIVAVDGRAIHEPDSLARTLDASPRLARRRVRSISDVRLSPAVSGDALGIRLAGQAAPRGVLVEFVRPGSVASQAGMRTGDRLLRVNDATVNSVAAAERALDDSAQALFIVFERDSSEHGVLIPR